MDAVISVIDDDEFVREATTGLLLSRGYAAEAFAAAEDFLACDALAHTRCLISDVRMPGLDGIELQRRLLDDGHRIPIIFITAKLEARLRAQAMQAGAVGILSKPFTEESLFACIDRALQPASRT